MNPLTKICLNACYPLHIPSPIRFSNSDVLENIQFSAREEQKKILKLMEKNNVQ